MLKIIKDFVEGNLDAPVFFDVLYSSDEMEPTLLSTSVTNAIFDAVSIYILRKVLRGKTK